MKVYQSKKHSSNSKLYVLNAAIIIFVFVLYCIVFYFIVSCCIVLYRIVFYFIVLYCIVICCIVSYFILLYCIVFKISASSKKLKKRQFCIIYMKKIQQKVFLEKEKFQCKHLFKNCPKVSNIA